MSPDRTGNERWLWAGARLLLFAAYFVVVLSVGVWWGFPLLILAAAPMFVDLRPVNTLTARWLSWVIFWSSMVGAVVVTFWAIQRSWLGILAFALFAVPWALHPNRRGRPFG